MHLSYCTGRRSSSPVKCPNRFHDFFALFLTVNYSQVMERSLGSASAGTRVSCPKCGFAEEGDAECGRCGIIFAKYKPPPDVQDACLTTSISTSPPETTGHLSRLFRLFPWISLAGTTLVLFLILKQAPPLTIQIDPQAAERVADKMAQLQVAIQSSQRHVATLNEAELNQWMRENLAIVSTHQAQQTSVPIPARHEATVKEVQSALKDLQVSLTGDRLRAYALFGMYGKIVSLQLEGTLEARDGYVLLKPSAGKIGSLPIPSSTLDRVVHQLFDSPQNRESFKLPPQVESLRIENNSLVIATR